MAVAKDKLKEAVWEWVTEDQYEKLAEALMDYMSKEQLANFIEEELLGEERFS